MENANRPRSKRSENSETRKLRNRISQKAFRARNAMRMKELEDRLHTGTCSDAEGVAYLQDQNAALRGQLLECHKKLVSLQVSMKACVDASALALGIQSLDGINETKSTTGRLPFECTSPRDAQIKDALNFAPTSGSNKQTNVHIISPELENDPIDELPNTTVANNNDEVNHNRYQAHGPEYWVSHHLSSDNTAGARTVFREGLDNQSVPNLNLDYFATVGCAEQFERSDDDRTHCPKERFCPEPMSLDLVFSEDLGPLTYRNILKTSPSIACQSFSLKRTNSPFSDHIDALEHCIHWSCSRWSTSSIPDDNSIGSVLLTFVSMSWQSMTAWHTYTKAHLPLRQLMAWRICRTPERYAKITPSYQPTRLQMSVVYPTIIDWIPWPQLRDELIRHHSANPCLDDIVCDIGNSYVVRADISLLIKCPQPVQGYLGVWDLVRAMAPEATGSPERFQAKTDTQRQPANYEAFAPQPVQRRTQMENTNTSAFENLTLPAKDADTLFCSRELAAQAFKLLGMDKGAFNFRLDPAFFGRHPELYTSSVDLMAQGVALRPSYRTSILAPRELDASVVGQYQEMSRYLIDVALESRLISQLS